MAKTSQAGSGEIIAAWVPPSLAAKLKRNAQDERRSLSSVVRNALEDQLQTSSPPVEGAARGGSNEEPDGQVSRRRGADAQKGGVPCT
jgi:hypothetical protein